MTNDLSAPPPEPAPPCSVSPDRKALEAALAGAAGLIAGRLLLGRAGGMLAGLAAAGVALVKKRVPAPATVQPSADLDSAGAALVSTEVPAAMVAGAPDADGSHEAPETDELHASPETAEPAGTVEATETAESSGSPGTAEEIVTALMIAPTEAPVVDAWFNGLTNERPRGGPAAEPSPPAPALMPVFQPLDVNDMRERRPGRGTEPGSSQDRSPVVAGEVIAGSPIADFADETLPVHAAETPCAEAPAKAQGGVTAPLAGSSGDDGTPMAELSASPVAEFFIAPDGPTMVFEPEFAPLGDPFVIAETPVSATETTIAVSETGELNSVLSGFEDLSRDFAASVPIDEPLPLAHDDFLLVPDPPVPQVKTGPVALEALAPSLRGLPAAPSPAVSETLAPAEFMPLMTTDEPAPPPLVWNDAGSISADDAPSFIIWDEKGTGAESDGPIGMANQKGTGASSDQRSWIPDTSSIATGPGDAAAGAMTEVPLPGAEPNPDDIWRRAAEEVALGELRPPATPAPLPGQLPPAAGEVAPFPSLTTAAVPPMSVSRDFAIEGDRASSVSAKDDSPGLHPDAPPANPEESQDQRHKSFLHTIRLQAPPHGFRHLSGATPFEHPAEPEVPLPAIPFAPPVRIEDKLPSPGVETDPVSPAPPVAATPVRDVSASDEVLSAPALEFVSAPATLASWPPAVSQKAEKPAPVPAARPAVVPGIKPPARSERSRGLTPLYFFLIILAAAGVTVWLLWPEIREYFTGPASGTLPRVETAPASRVAPPVRVDGPADPAPEPAPTPIPFTEVTTPPKRAPSPAPVATPPATIQPAPSTDPTPPEPPPAAPPATSPAIPPADESPAIAPPTDDKEVLPVSADGARRLVLRLLGATRAESVLPYILESARLKPVVSQYYETPQTPVTPTAVQIERADKVTSTGRTGWVFRVVPDASSIGFPVGIDDTPQGLRVDWELFIQCKDRSLARFVADKNAATASFYVALTRSAYSEELAPDERDKFLIFRIFSPVVDDPARHAFIPKGTELANRAAYFQWEQRYTPVIELAHKNGRLEITGIPRKTWRRQ